jgi:hypothetical protein
VTVNDLAEFFALVKALREAQRAYFKSRCAANLERAKELERKVDAAIKAAESQPTLF